MYRNSLKVISFILFAFTATSFGQVTENPSVGFSSWNNTRITRVELTADSTNVTVEYTKTQKDSKQAWVSFSSSTYLRPKGGFVSYHVQAMGDKKELDKRYTTIDAIGTKYVFTLIFPKLEPGVEYFDIIEPPDGFRWENVTIRNPKLSVPATTTAKTEIQVKTDVIQEPRKSDSETESLELKKETIAKLEAEYLKALTNADIDALERLVSSTYSTGYSNATKASFINSVKSKQNEYLSYETSGVQIDFQGNLAKVSGSLKSERLENQERKLIEGTFKRTWKFEDNKWQLLSTDSLEGTDRYAKRTPVSEMEALAKSLKPKKSLVFRYDKFADLSAVETDPYNLVGGGESFVAELAVGMARQNGNYDTKDIITDVYLRAGVGFKGRTLVGKPPAYLLFLVTTATSWQLLGKDKTLYFIIDEDRLKLEPADNPDTEVGGNSTSGVRTYESIGYWISATDLAKIVKGKSVELRLGSTKPRKMKQELQNRIGNLLVVTGNESLISPRP